MWFNELKVLATKPVHLSSKPPDPCGGRKEPTASCSVFYTYIQTQKHTKHAHTHTHIIKCHGSITHIIVGVVNLELGL